MCTYIYIYVCVLIECPHFNNPKVGIKGTLTRNTILRVPILTHTHIHTGVSFFFVWGVPLLVGFLKGNRKAEQPRHLGGSTPRKDPRCRGRAAGGGRAELGRSRGRCRPGGRAARSETLDRGLRVPPLDRETARRKKGKCTPYFLLGKKQTIR